MPKKVEKCVKEVKKSGVPEDQAWAICQEKFGSKSATETLRSAHNNRINKTQDNDKK